MAYSPVSKACKRPRSIQSEHRTFREAWEEEYLFVECPKEKATCLLCKEKVNVLKRYNLERHYRTRHSGFTANFPLNSKLRSAKVASLKQALLSQQKIFLCQMKESEAVTEASFKICYLLAKHKKPFTDAELMKQCFLSAAEILFDSYTNKASILKEIGALQLSDSTCARRIEAMGQNVKEQVIQAVRESPFFSIALDESTDIGDVAQLLVWVRYLDQSLHPKEELLCLLPLHGHTRGEDVLNSMCNYFNTNDIPLNTLVSITTDGAPAMVGHDRGFVSMLKKKLIGQTVIDYHCIIHQEVLCAKLKHGELNNVLKGAVKIVNFIRAKALNHRLFKAMLQESEAEETDILMHTDVRWLSKGKVLERFIALLPEIVLFVNSRGQSFPELTNVKWLVMLHFLTDLFTHFNTLNLTLQGKQQLVCSLMNGIYAFESKLVLFKEQLDDSDFTHFPKLLAVMQRFPEAQEILANLDPGACLEEISGEIKRRFSQFRALTPLFRLVENPWMVSARNLDVVALIGMERAQAELELIDMQHNSALEASFLGQPPEEFWKIVPPDQFPLLVTVAQKVLCMFGSTYACECSFSTMGLLKSKLRNKLTDIHLEQLLRLAVSTLVPEYRKLIGDMKCKISS
ncbi:general transcription factor II-I repeat domain-containing protein 2B-like [Lissotriton helveticus]